MQPSYGELISIGIFWHYIIGICTITVSTCFVVHLCCVLSKDRLITREIIKSVNETTVIFDRHDKPCYVNICIDRGNIMEFLQRINETINKSGLTSENLTLDLFEGEIKPFSGNGTVFSWKMCPVVKNNKYMGRILVFNDITQYKKLLEQLDNQNRQLKDALEAQRKYAEVARRLVAEEERERIMNLLNKIAQGYLKQLRESAKVMEKYAVGNTQEDTSVFEAENDRMIKITRETIGEIRNTAKVLHVSP